MQIFGKNFQIFLAPPDVLKNIILAPPPTAKRQQRNIWKDWTFSSRKSWKKIFQEWIVYSKYSILKFLI